FKGNQAFDLYLKCLQLILRRQVWFLIHEKGLPAELENVVIDLWALRILQLEEQIADVHGYDSQSHVFSTSENDPVSERETTKSKGRGSKLKSTPGLIDILALSYLGILTLRLPVTPGDILSWIKTKKMPYDKAIKYIPIAMRDRLPSNYHAILDPNATLKPERLYSAVIDLESIFEKEYGLVWPNINNHLLLFRYLKDLALPLELYEATIRLAGYLNYDFTYPIDGHRRLGIRYLPEAQLAACLVVCVKLMYPLDGQRRNPKTISEPAAIGMNWDDWYEQISSTRQSGFGSASTYTTDDLVELREQDVFAMSGNQLDQYLDWYQDTFIDETRTEQTEEGDFLNALYKLFPINPEPRSEPRNTPLENLADAEKLNLVRAIHGRIQHRQVIEEGKERPDTVRPGEMYIYYPKEKELPEQAKRFYGEVARISGLSLEMLIMAVFFAEKKIEKWEAIQRKKSKPDVLGI
ncbi:uncharacterized protein BDR25DRAFT_219859, partial [Lindgomyces ingoldianus]